MAAFLGREIRFDQIHRVNMETLASTQFSAPRSIDDLLEIDQSARQIAQRTISRLAP